MKNYKKKLEEYEIEDEKDRYVFRVNKKYAASSSIFFITLSFVALYSLYKGLAGIEKLTPLKIILISVLLVYVTVSVCVLFNYKIVMENDFIISGKNKVNINEIVAATVKVDRIGGKKFDRCLEIITEDKKKIKYRLNIGKDLLFVKLIQNKIKDKLSVEVIK